MALGAERWRVDADTNGFFFKQKTAYVIAACLVGSGMCIRDRDE